MGGNGYADGDKKSSFGKWRETGGKNTIYFIGEELFLGGTVVRSKVVGSWGVMGELY